ncbi:energy transducer TonB [Rhodospirillum centenum]|uniref:Protein TonB n=1 Tax=Rhodospirillum centenum (strain ATCC 51521 / SW) TaxID=414684 RepID=B6IRM9_RHOCS|nr:energy transducer TonB [Rhodospirillum centenum]ACI98115.1 protein TonB [Rhodospirillum centenum SW]
MSLDVYRPPEADPRGRLIGIGFVIVLHILLVYALVTGLARKAVEIVAAPIKTEIIEELKPELPDEPPPPPPPPTFDTPPPPYIPPPEIQVAQPPPQTQAIVATTTEKPKEMPPPPTRFTEPKRESAKPDARSFTRPEYPAMSVRLEEEGSTVLRLFCAENGRITEAEVQTSSGHPRLDDATLKEAKRGRWKCKPGTADGKPEGSWFLFKYTWRLEDAR